MSDVDLGSWMGLCDSGLVLDEFLKRFGGVLEGFGGVLEGFGGVLEGSWGCFGGILGVE